MGGNKCPFLNLTALHFVHLLLHPPHNVAFTLLELSTTLHEFSQCLKMAPKRAFSFLEAPTCIFTNKNLLRHFATQVLKNGKY